MWSCDPLLTLPLKYKVQSEVGQGDSGGGSRGFRGKGQGDSGGKVKEIQGERVDGIQGEDRGDSGGGSTEFRGGRVKGIQQGIQWGGSKGFRDWVWCAGGMDQTTLHFLIPHLHTSSMPGRLPSSALKTLQMDLMVRCETSFVRNICSVFSFWLLQK